MNVTEIINKIKEVALSQKTVNSVFDGDVYENWNSGEIQFGSVNVGIQTVLNEQQITTFSIVLYYGDRLLQDKSNVNDIWTDGCNTLQSIINILNSFDMVNIEEPIEFTLFEQKFMDYLAGAYCNVDIVTDSVLGTCEMDEYTYIDERFIEGYESGYTDAIEARPLTSIAISKNGSYIAAKGGYSGITVDVQAPNYVTFTAQANSTIGLVKLSTNQQLWYSTDGDNWSAMTTGTTVSLVNSGDSVYVRGVLSNNNSSSNYTNFRMTGKIAASGNINYIWNYENPDAALKEYCGYRLFNGCTSLVIAPELPAMVLSRECYGSMFRGCTSLTTAPQLPAMTLAFQCYSSMFNGCTSLTQAPQLPATSINSECYAHMFNGCTSLTTAPELPAKTAMSTCYKNMFTNCTALTEAPILPATLMGQQAYEGMFMGCTNLTTVPYIAMPEIAWIGCANMFENCRSLNYVKCAATSFKDSATREWFRLVPAGGTFVRDYNATWSTGINGIPEGWTVLVDNVPESALS